MNAANLIVYSRYGSRFLTIKVGSSYPIKEFASDWESVQDMTGNAFLMLVDMSSVI